MDAKSLAKSKRAHSLSHAKKPQHHPHWAPPSPGSRTGNKAPPAVGRQARERNRLANLSSNWDRYEDEEEDESNSTRENAAGEAADDVVLPKSKGADYRHMIAEAEAEAQSRRPLSSSCSLYDGFLSLGDVLPVDFSRKMLSVRGGSILEWIGDDNFVVEDEAASDHEASIFSLNLHALSDQLAKVDLPERLFIEADLLAPEMELETSSSEEAHHGNVSAYKATTASSEISSFDYLSEKNKLLNHTREVISSDFVASGSTFSNSANQGLDTHAQLRADSTSSQDCRSSQSRAVESPTHDNRSYIINPKSNPSAFEVASADAELDMLLNSFSETKISGSSAKVVSIADGSSNQYSAYKGLDVLSQVEVDSLSSQGSQSIQNTAMDFPRQVSMSYDVKPKKHPSTFKTAAAEAELDMLLNSFSDTESPDPSSADFVFDTLTNLKSGASAATSPVARQVLGSSKSWSITANLDNALDDLLEETSTMMNQNGSNQPEKANTGRSEQQSSSSSEKANTGRSEQQSSSSWPVSKSNAFDDFDSWMDTI